MVPVKDVQKGGLATNAERSHVAEQSGRFFWPSTQQLNASSNMKKNYAHDVVGVFSKSNAHQWWEHCDFLGMLFRVTIWKQQKRFAYLHYIFPPPPIISLKSNGIFNIGHFLGFISRYSVGACSNQKRKKNNKKTKQKQTLKKKTHKEKQNASFLWLPRAIVVVLSL